MCVAGGRRCPGSHRSSAKQRARRKANNAYRAAVAQAVEDMTGNLELARKVKAASMTDVADVVTAAGLNGEAIAKQCGTASYKGADGVTTVVDVEPTGTVRRTPITDDTRALLAEVCEEAGVYEPGPFADAVAAGDREAQEEYREGVADHVANRLEQLESKDLTTAGLVDIDLDLDELNNLNSYSKKYAGQDLDPETKAAVAKLAARYEKALNEHPENDILGPNDPEPDPLANLRGIYGFGEVTEDNVEDVIAAANDDIDAVELGTLTDKEFDAYYGMMDELDDRVRAVTGESGIDGFVANVNDEWDYRNMDDDDKYEFHDEYRRASQLDKWAQDTMNANNTDSESARGALAAAEYLYRYDHPRQKMMTDEERSNNADDAVEWAAGVLDNEDAGAFERGIAETVVTQRKWDQIRDVTPYTLSDKEFEAHAARFDAVRERIEDGRGNALDTFSTQDDMTRMAEAIEADRQRRATSAALRGVSDTYGFGDITADNVEDVIAAANNDIDNTDFSSLSDEEFDEYFDRMNDLDDRIREVTGESGIESFVATVNDEWDYRNQDENGKYEFFDEYRRTDQVNQWAQDVVDTTDQVPADAHERGKYQAAKYLSGRGETERFVDSDALSWAQSVLDDEGGDYGAFERGIARNVQGKHTLDTLRSADVASMSESEKDQARKQATQLRDNIDDYPLLATDYGVQRQLEDLAKALGEEI